jgi:hypothetical protein
MLTEQIGAYLEAGYDNASNIQLGVAIKVK